MAGNSSTSVGMGGMKTKVEAAQICLESGIKALITGKSKIEKLPATNLEAGSLEKLGTLFSN